MVYSPTDLAGEKVQKYTFLKGVEPGAVSTVENTEAATAILVKVYQEI